MMEREKVIAKLSEGLQWSEAQVAVELVQVVFAEEVAQDSVIEHGVIHEDGGSKLRFQSGAHTVAEIMSGSRRMTSALKLSSNGKIYCIEYLSKVDLDPVGVEIAGHVLSAIRAGKVYNHTGMDIGWYLIIQDRPQPMKLLIVFHKEAE